ncbi:hypothetical protein N657DRAFT_643016, partial [Parathielavia appendiculata]
MVPVRPSITSPSSSLMSLCLPASPQGIVPSRSVLAAREHQGSQARPALCSRSILLILIREADTLDRM